MIISKSKFYLLLLFACLAGYSWIIFKFQTQTTTLYSGCLFKYVTNKPCPSCGTTRSVLSILHGNITHAFWINPLGFLAVGFLFITPIWTLVDLITKRQSLLNYYLKAILFLKNRKIAFLFICLIALNWIWNLYKDL
jgi:hypothetical protein